MNAIAVVFGLGWLLKLVLVVCARIATSYITHVCIPYKWAFVSPLSQAFHLLYLPSNIHETARKFHMKISFTASIIIITDTQQLNLFVYSILHEEMLYLRISIHTFYPQNGDDDKGVLSIYLLLALRNNRTMAWNGGKSFWNGNFRSFAAKPYSIMMTMMMVRSPPLHSVNRIEFDLIRNLYSNLIYIIVLHVKYVRIYAGPPHYSVRNEWAYQIPWITFIKSQSNGNDYEQPTSKDNNRKANEWIHK